MAPLQVLLAHDGVGENDADAVVRSIPERRNRTQSRTAARPIEKVDLPYQLYALRAPTVRWDNPLVRILFVLVRDKLSPSPNAVIH
jgi:hypothetical protein